MSTVPASTDALVERLFGAVLAALDLQAVHLGDRLGWYRCLAGAAGGLTPPELAGRTATAERYAREWLEQQAVTGILTVDDPSAGPRERRYRLPDEHVEPLTDELSTAYLVPLARLLAAFGARTDDLVTAYRSGGGVTWAQQGPHAREAQAAANRPMFLGALGREYLPSIPDVDAALRGGGQVADVGCGFGRSSIGIALAYPDATVDGFDLDAPSIEAAKRHAREAGVAERVRFHLTDMSGPAGSRTAGYALVTAFECIHDLPDPVSVLAGMRTLAEPDGVVLVMDERVAEGFTAPGDDIERLMYGYSLLCCLPDGLAHPPSVGTGTVMRPDTLRRYAVQAGFSGIEVLDIVDDFFRFYRLR
ncbi:MAG: class I SAM-dependent methyltransferase [Pseudonocardia sp.]|nr:class I SAM-dependent methyltransferase [Pseudonocardia sp.]